MSKSSLTNEIKVEALRLYRNILKLHQRKLAEDMRLFGDYFLKTEFTLNYRQADENQMKLFLKGWTDYEKNIERIADLKNKENVENFKNNISSTEDSLKTKMDIDQKQIFNEIKNIINK